MPCRGAFGARGVVPRPATGSFLTTGACATISRGCVLYARALMEAKPLDKTLVVFLIPQASGGPPRRGPPQRLSAVDDLNRKNQLRRDSFLSIYAGGYMPRKSRQPNRGAGSITKGAAKT